jgi:glycosidase
VDQYLDSIHEKNPNAMLCSFIANHDTDRAAGFLQVGFGQVQVAANLNILTPGSPFIYYGEEIGMLGSRGGANTDANRRLAMLWGDDDLIRDPEGTTYSKDKQIQTTVADQMEDENSLYRYYCKLLSIRHRHPAIARGVYTAANCEKNLGGFLIRYEEEALVVLHNNSAEEITYDLANCTALKDVQLTQLLETIGSGNATLKGTTLTIGAYTSVVIG